jgi:hypothetical protein
MKVCEKVWDVNWEWFMRYVSMTHLNENYVSWVFEIGWKERIWCYGKWNESKDYVEVCTWKENVKENTTKLCPLW